MDVSTKQQFLDQIAREIISFKGIDIAKNCTKAVPGEGNPDAKIMFIGEGPGFNEDQQGRPFVGAAGKLLEKSLLAIGLSRQEVYITNIVKYRPPENRDPFPEEIEACKNWLDRQISVIHPQIIVTLGRFSMAKFLGPQSISRIHGQSRYTTWESQLGNLETEQFTIVVFPVFHPAAALRRGEVMREFIADFQKLKNLLIEVPTQPKPLVIDKLQKDQSPVQQALF